MKINLGLHVVAGAMLAAFARDPAAAGEPVAESLFARLGGKPGIVQITDQLLDEVRQDPQTKRPFAKINAKRFKKNLAEQLCALTGGPCKFSGDDMKTTHAGLEITQAEFYGLVQHLRDILDSNHIGTREKNELLAILAPMKRDVVSK